MGANEWMSVVVEIAVWAWDAIRMCWDALSLRDVLLFLILLGLWACLRDLDRILWRLRRLHEKVGEREDFNDLSRFYKRLQEVDDKIDALQRTLGVK